MDPVSKLIAGWKIPIGKWGKAAIDFIVTYFQWFFDGLSAVLEWGVEGTTFLLLQVPPVILAVALAGFAYWLQRSRALALGVLLPNPRVVLRWRHLPYHRTSPRLLPTIPRGCWSFSFTSMMCHAGRSAAPISRP